MLSSILLGLALGLVCLIPGVYPTGVLLACLPFVGTGPLDWTLIIGLMTGLSLMLAILPACYVPVGRGLIAYADAATQLAYEGYGPTVVRLHKQAAQGGLFVVCFVAGLAFILPSLGGTSNPMQTLALLIKPFAPWLLGALCLWLIARTGNRFGSGLVFLLAGILGLMAFRLGPQNDWLLFTLLGGLFGAPALWELSTSRPEPLPPEAINHTPVSYEVCWQGGLLGLLAGFMAGLGAGSLAAVLRRESEPEEYLMLGSSAEAANSVFALVGFWLIGSSRSGTAAVLSTLSPNGAQECLYGLAWIIAGVMLGGWLLTRLEPAYEYLWQLLPTQGFGWLSLGAWISGAYLGLGLWGLALALGAWSLGSFAKRVGASNQSLMGCLAAPVFVYAVGF